MRKLFIAAVVLPLTGSAWGCESILSPSTDTTLDGTWMGTGSVFRGTTSLPATLTFVLAKHPKITKTAVPVTGTWTMTFADPSNNKSGTVTLTAQLKQECSGVTPDLIFCYSSDPWVAALQDGSMTSSAACSTFWVSPYLATPTSLSLAVGMNAPGCNFSTSLNQGQFTLTKQ